MEQRQLVRTSRERRKEEKLLHEMGTGHRYSVFICISNGLLLKPKNILWNVTILSFSASFFPPLILDWFLLHEEKMDAHAAPFPSKTKAKQTEAKYKENIRHTFIRPEMFFSLFAVNIFCH